MTGPFYLGETPAAFRVTAVLPDGTTPDLSTYTTVLVVSDGLPAGTTTVTDAPHGVLTYTPTAPPTQTGRYTLHAALTGPGGTDTTRPVPFDVLDRAAAGNDGWLTPADVYSLTRRPVTAANITDAAADVSAVVGVTLTTAVERDRYMPQDRYLLGMAVSWQAVYRARVEAYDVGAPDAALPYGATMVKQDGAWLALDLPAGHARPLTIDPTANRYLLALSTRQRAVYSAGLTSEADALYPGRPYHSDPRDAYLWRRL